MRTTQTIYFECFECSKNGLYIGYYTGSRLVRLDIFTSLMYSNTYVIYKDEYKYFYAIYSAAFTFTFRAFSRRV